ncbi:hypothetical protein [Desertimonas flava]|nr:hypothetical protein [Desertimonas flava]
MTRRPRGPLIDRGGNTTGAPEEEQDEAEATEAGGESTPSRSAAA